MKASEATEKALKEREGYVYESIKDSTKDGDLYTAISFLISDSLKAQLEQEGYFVQLDPNSDGHDYTYISWGSEAEKRKNRVLSGMSRSQKTVLAWFLLVLATVFLFYTARPH